jgi:hypothetical protein
VEIFSVDKLRKVVDNHQSGEFVFPNSKGKLVVDVTTASVCIMVLDNVKDQSLKQDIERIISSSRQKFEDFVSRAWSCVK